MNVFRLFGEIAINSKEAIAEINKTTNAAEKSSTKISSSFKSIGTKSKELGEKFRGVSMAASGLLASIVANTEMTRDYRTEQGKLEAAFTTSGHSMENATKTFEGLQAVLGETDQSVEAANHLAKLCQTEQELQTWTTICTGVFAEFGDSLPIEGLTEAANETAKTGVVTGSLADALNWAGVSEDAFNKQLASCTSEQERQALITGTLNELYEDSADAYKKANKEVMAANEAQENLTNSLAAVAEKVEPIITKFKNLAATFLEKIANMNDGVFNFILIITGIVAALAPVLSVFGMVATGVGSLIRVFGSLSKIIAVVRTAFTTLGAAMMANPIGIIIMAITALVAAFVLLWKKCDWFREFWINLWGNIKEKAAEAKEKIVTTFNNLKESVSNIFNGIKSVATAVFAAVGLAITNPVEAARLAVRTMIDKIKSYFKFNWSLPKLKLPHFSIKPSGWKIGDLLEGTIPKLGITWYAKGGIFDQPTIIPTLNGLKGVGEAGAEAVAPISELQKYVASAVASQNGEMTQILTSILSAIKQMDAGMYKSIEAALDNRKIQWNDRELGRLVSKYA